jgi:betaine-aldehyde dehydrogenase
MRQGADTLKRVVLELGGKNALIICADADVDKAVAGALKGMNLGWTAGQSCGSTSRVFIHDSLYDDVVTRLSDAFQSISLGDPARPDTQMGCLTTRAQYDKTLDYIRIAEQEGARMAAGGAPDMSGALSDGYFVRPTLFADVTPDMRIAREEVFGPVLSVLRWSDKQAMLHAVNGLELGLTASIWTRDLALAFELVNAVEAGYVWVNNASDHFLGAPFGGVKQSGIGREECLEELLAYTEQKNVSISLD